MSINNQDGVPQKKVLLLVILLERENDPLIKCLPFNYFTLRKALNTRDKCSQM